MSLLIVDADPDSRSALQTILTEARQWNIVAVATAEEAMRAMDAGGVQLVLADLMAPGMDGLELCRQISARPEFSRVPLVMTISPENRETVNRIYEAGACDYIMRPLHLDEVVARVGAVLRNREHIDQRAENERQLVVENRKLAETNQSLQRQSLVDPLTDVANRRSFDETLERVWRGGARHDFPVSLIMIDIDFFKLFNDELGHPAGDACLRRVASGLAGALKRADDFLARYGGEEFVVILARTDLEGAAVVAERLRRSIENLGIFHPASPAGPSVTISQGVACQMPAAWLTAASVVAAADQALYEAKRLGRNRCQLALSDFAAQPSQNRTPRPGGLFLRSPKS